MCTVELASVIAASFTSLSTQEVERPPLPIVRNGTVTHRTELNRGRATGASSAAVKSCGAGHVPRAADRDRPSSSWHTLLATAFIWLCRIDLLLARPSVVATQLAVRLCVAVTLCWCVAHAQVAQQYSCTLGKYVTARTDRVIQGGICDRKPPLRKLAQDLLTALDFLHRCAQPMQPNPQPLHRAHLCHL